MTFSEMNVSKLFTAAQQERGALQARRNGTASYHALRLPHPRHFFFKYTAPTEIYTLSLHDALPISSIRRCDVGDGQSIARWLGAGRGNGGCWRSEGTRLNSSHSSISYAVFCLK